MDINKLTQKCQEAVQQAGSLSTRFGHRGVDGEHLLLALADQTDGLFPRLLRKLDADPKAFADVIVAHRNYFENLAVGAKHYIYVPTSSIRSSSAALS